MPTTWHTVSLSVVVEPDEIRGIRVLSLVKPALREVTAGCDGEPRSEYSTFISCSRSGK